MIGVYSQPVRLFSTWKSRGVDTLFKYEAENDANNNPTVSLDQWKTAARAAGLRYFCLPSSNPLADSQDPYLAGWLLDPDEPDDKYVSGDTGVIDSLVAQYQQLKAVSPKTPVAINIDLWQMQWNKLDYNKLVSACDILCGDFYPVNRGDDTFAVKLDALKALAGSRQVLACLECSNQNLDKQYFPTGRGPTSTEMLAQAKLLLARGINPVWFPQSFGPFQYDGTTADQASGMIACNQLFGSGSVAPSVPTPTPTVAPTPTPTPSKTLLKTLTVSIYSDGSISIT